jgi:hypothetical protein
VDREFARENIQYENIRALVLRYGVALTEDQLMVFVLPDKRTFPDGYLLEVTLANGTEISDKFITAFAEKTQNKNLSYLMSQYMKLKE